MGWHQCRWGYNSTEAMKEVIEGYETGKFPLDVLWSDIDYMNQYEDFTVSEAFDNLP